MCSSSGQSYHTPWLMSTSFVSLLIWLYNYALSTTEVMWRRREWGDHHERRSLHLKRLKKITLNLSCYLPERHRVATLRSASEPKRQATFAPSDTVRVHVPLEHRGRGLIAHPRRSLLMAGDSTTHQTKTNGRKELSCCWRVINQQTAWLLKKHETDIWKQQHS
jgi:hypothetical protein